MLLMLGLSYNVFSWLPSTSTYAVFKGTICPYATIDARNNDVQQPCNYFEFQSIGYSHSASRYTEIKQPSNQ
jgi:hypothetical protein